MTRPDSSLRDALSIRLRAFAASPHTRIYADRRFLFLGVAGVAAATLFALRPDAAPGVVELAEAEVPAAPAMDLSRHDLWLEDGSEERLRTVRFTLGPGDNLGPMLQDHGVSPGTAHRLVAGFAESFSPRRLRVGHSFEVGFDGDTVTGMAFKPDVERTVFVEKDGEGFTSREVAAEFRYEVVTLRADIENSIYLDAKRMGAPDRVIQQFANIYEYSVDFQRDIRRGDRMEMFFEVARDRDGKIVKSGDLLFTGFTPGSKTQEYYLFADANGDENYYDAQGKTAKRKLRATPVNGARLSSGFGSRRHPVLGYRKMHKGVDFAAPRGTPILAAGTGVVERANRYGSFGNYIRIRHTDGYKTAYAHLKGFAVKKGQRVKQDQVIGYVGTTGRSTGPHLHYEVHHHGKAINPRRLAQLSGKPLPKSMMADFAARRAEIDARRAVAPDIAPVAVVAEDRVIPVAAAASGSLN